MLSLIKTALCLQYRILPAWTHQESGLKKSEVPRPYSLPTFSVPWLKNQEDPTRKAAVVLKSDKGSSEWMLSEDESLHRFDLYSRQGDHCFVPLSGNNADEIKQRLLELEKDPDLLEDLQRFQFKAYQEFQNTDGEFSMVLLAENPRKLQEEILQAQRAVNDCFQNSQDWQTPSGSYFTPQPLGDSDIAFVYPGGFNSYVGSGKSLFEMDPELHQRISTYSYNSKRK